MQMHPSGDLLHTNMFLKIQNIHALAPFYINSEHCDSLTLRFLSVFSVLFSKISISSVVLFPVFYSGGLDFAWRGC